jgi:hypothetical protein
MSVVRNSDQNNINSLHRLFRVYFSNYLEYNLIISTKEPIPMKLVYSCTCLRAGGFLYASTGGTILSYVQKHSHTNFKFSMEVDFSKLKQS